MPDGDWSKAREVAEDYLNKNPIIVEVRKPVLYSQSSNMYFVRSQAKKTFSQEVSQSKLR